MVGAVLSGTFLFLLLTLPSLPLASAQGIYYIRPTASEAAPPCEDCLTLSEYARDSSTYFNSDNLTLVFLPGEHSLDTTFVFELLESVLLVGDTTSLPNVTSKIVCSQQLAALSFTNVSKVEIKAIMFASCGNGSTKSSNANLDTLLEQPDNVVPAVSALFIPIFHLTNCSMEQCYLPLLLNKSRLFLQHNTFEQNMGLLGGATAAYKSTLVFLGRNVFQDNHAEFGGGIFAKASRLDFKESTVFIGNSAGFGGGGIAAVDSNLYYDKESGYSNGFHEHKVHTYVQNSALFGGGLLLVRSFMKQSDGILNFTENSAGNGGGLSSNFSSVLLEGLAIFTSNSAKDLVGASYHGLVGLGGAVHIWFSRWTSTAITFVGNFAKMGGAISSQSSHMNFTAVLHKTGTHMPQEKSTFSTVQVCTCLLNNSAAMMGGGLRADNSTVEFNGISSLEDNSARDFGGGIRVLDSTLYFKGNTTFLNNSAGSPGGGALSTTFADVHFEGNTKFIGNFANGDGGAADYIKSFVIIWGEIAVIDNTASINGGGIYTLEGFLYITGTGWFINNRAGVSGGAVRSTEGGHTVFKGEHIMEANSALYGGAVAVVEGHAVFTGNNNFIQNMAVYGGAVFTNEGRDVVFRGKNTFVNNSATSVGYGGYGGGIHAVQTKMVVSGQLSFTKNSAWYGGGVSVTYYNSKHFIVAKKASILFLENHAQKHGGAILVEDAPISYCGLGGGMANTSGGTLCFFQFLDKKHSEYEEVFRMSPDGYQVMYVYVNVCTGYITFESNIAREGGNIIYGGALHACRVQVPLLFTKRGSCGDYIYDEYVTGLEAMAALMNTSLKDTTTRYHGIASDPFKICICVNMKPDCSQRAATLPIYPGETVFFPVVAVGQANGVVPGVVHAQIIESEEVWIDELQSTQSVNMTCTTLSYTLLSHEIGSANLSLSAEGPCGEAGIPLVVNLSFVSCPVGFALSQSGSCQCGQRLQKYTNSCDINSRAITRSGDFWLGVDVQSHDLILHPHCPFDYCKLETVSFTLNSTDLQCADGRSGTLCGACKAGLSLNLGSSQCSPCSNAFLPLFIAFAIAGVFLVMFLFTCKVTVSAGTTSGLMFYANILAINQSVFFPSGETNVLTVFIAWLNLDLGIETCLFNGMDMYTWTWLQFVFPFYIWLLVCAIIVVSYYSTKVAKLIGSTNPVSVLATLFLLSYTKLLRTIIAIFSFTTLDYPNDRRVPVWAYDGNIGYLEGKHIPLFLAGLLAFLFLFLPYTLLLLFGQCIVAASNHRLFFWASNLKVRSFLDAHHAPYKTQHCYWTGLLLLIRSLLFITSAVININSPRDPSVNLLVLAITCAGLLTWILNTGSMYKKWYNNALESSFILNLAILAAASYQVKVEGGSQAAVVYASISVAFLSFIGVMVYHARERIKSSQVWRSYARAKLRLCMETLFHHPQHHQEPIEMAVPPTAPQPPVPTTFVELREPLLESQH